MPCGQNILKWVLHYRVGLVKNKFQIGFEKVQPAGAISYDALSNRYFIYTWNIHCSKHHYGYFFTASIFQPFIVGILYWRLRSNFKWYHGGFLIWWKRFCWVGAIPKVTKTSWWLNFILYKIVIRVASRIWMQLPFFTNALFCTHQVTIWAWSAQQILVSCLFSCVPEEAKALLST